MDVVHSIISAITFFVEFVLHLDIHLLELMNTFGVWMYGIVFVIVFCETGLVITPFLPGDSLLFALGTLTALEGSSLELLPLILVLASAALCGDLVNYTAGKFIGPKIFYSQQSRFLNKNHLVKTQVFYEKHGPMTIIIARFMPIIRTFAPFVAGIGKMRFPKFAMFSVTGALAWVLSFTIVGHFFGNIPVVKKNFTLLIFGIIIVSVLPIAVGFYKEWKQNRKNIKV